jgi:hypothetical protein
MPNRTVTIRLISAGNDAGGFTIKDQSGVVLFTNVTRESIMSANGLTIEVPYETTSLTIVSTGVCTTEKSVALSVAPPLITRYYELVPCDSQLPNVYTKLENTLPNNLYVKAGMNPIFYVYEGAYIDQTYDPSNLDTSIVTANGIGCP